jgi:hypothetical protein
MTTENVGKKQKKEGILDYSRMPSHIWDKTFKEFTNSMNNIEASLERLKVTIDSASNGSSPC